jgi:hypothetical protein
MDRIVMSRDAQLKATALPPRSRNQERAVAVVLNLMKSIQSHAAANSASANKTPMPVSASMVSSSVMLPPASTAHDSRTWHRARLYLDVPSSS